MRFFVYILSSEALAEAEDILRLDEKYTDGYLNCARALYGLGDERRAYDIANQGLKLEPKRMTFFS